MSRPPKEKIKPRPGNRLRIIGGQWRGRKLGFADAEGLRPTGDRIRETLFNWLAPHIAGARCLDAFAGSGALGLEAASRGAGEVLLLDNSADVIATINAHRKTLGSDAFAARQANTLDWLGTAATQRFDIIFLDPPFGRELLAPAMASLQRHGWLANGALVYVETDRHTPAAAPPDWQLLKAKQSGAVDYRLYQAGA